ncbi:MAG: hypothetical protein CVV14_02840 [Gammaproteobacteria bacterium HGW-Gammaproteobacteria-4]|nr:MAG: hypothetical protein CVV14_02840 [Gammaproteobacteria bacterium HGW-Gammaproteobacteria-4]
MSWCAMHGGSFDASHVADSFDGDILSAQPRRGWVQLATPGTASSANFLTAPSANRYVPKTALGRRLLALREAAIRDGAELIPVRAIIADIAAFRS